LKNQVKEMKTLWEYDKTGKRAGF